MFCVSFFVEIFKVLPTVLQCLQWRIMTKADAFLLLLFEFKSQSFDWLSTQNICITSCYWPHHYPGSGVLVAWNGGSLIPIKHWNNGVNSLNVKINDFFKKRINLNHDFKKSIFYLNCQKIQFLKFELWFKSTEYTPGCL